MTKGMKGYEPQDFGVDKMNFFDNKEAGNDVEEIGPAIAAAARLVPALARGAATAGRAIGRGAATATKKTGKAIKGVGKGTSDVALGGLEVADSYFQSKKAKSKNENKFNETHEVGFSKEDMEILHKNGKLEKDGHTYLYKEHKLREFIRNAIREVIQEDLPGAAIGGIGGGAVGSGLGAGIGAAAGGLPGMAAGHAVGGALGAGAGALGGHAMTDDDEDPSDKDSEEWDEVEEVSPAVTTAILAKAGKVGYNKGKALTTPGKKASSGPGIGDTIRKAVGTGRKAATKQSKDKASKE